MKIINGKGNPNVAVDLVSPKFLPDDDYVEGALADGLKFSLTQKPEHVFFHFVMDDDERVRGFLIGFHPPKQKHTFILQAWSDLTGSDRKWFDSVFLRMVLWTQAKGLSEIRMETTRDPSVMHRRWGFEPLSQVMAYEISDDFEERILEGKRDVLAKKDEEEKEDVQSSEDSTPNVVSLPSTESEVESAKPPIRIERRDRSNRREEHGAERTSSGSPAGDSDRPVGMEASRPTDSPAAGTPNVDARSPL